MNTKFENYKDLIDFDMIDTYYDEVKDYKYFINQLQEDRVESQKYIVNANKKIERLNNIIDDLKQKNNLAENILYDYLYNDGKITKEEYEQFKGLKEGK